MGVGPKFSCIDAVEYLYSRAGEGRVMGVLLQRLIDRGKHRNACFGFDLFIFMWNADLWLQ